MTKKIKDNDVEVVKDIFGIVIKSNDEKADAAVKQIFDNAPLIEKEKKTKTKKKSYYRRRRSSYVKESGYKEKYFELLKKWKELTD